MSGGELLDHLIGLSLERQRNGEAERPSGVEIEYELHLSRLQDREVGWLFSLEHSGGVGSSLPIDRGKIGAVANETAFDGKLAKLVHRRNAVLGRQSDKRCSPACKIRIVVDEQSTSSAVAQYCERRVELILV